MGRLIDADKLIEYWLTPPNNIGWADEIECVNNQPTIEAIPKDQYETRLKSDMVAMLEEFDLELSEYEDADLIRVEYIRQDIQEKIDKLKEDE